MNQLTNLFSSINFENLLNSFTTLNIQESLTNLISSTTTDLQTNIQDNLTSLITSTTTDLQTNLQENLTSLVNLTTTNLTNLFDHLYTNYVNSEAGQTDDDQKIDNEEFTVITGDSEILNTLKEATAKGMISVGKYESDLLNSINELTKDSEYRFDFFDINIQLILKKVTEQIEWAKLTIQFQNFQKKDKLLLLKNSWSSNLLLDNLYQRIHHNLSDQMKLANGQNFNLIALALLGNDDLLAERELEEIQIQLTKLKFDYVDYIFMKFLLLLDLDLTRLNDAIHFKDWKLLKSTFMQIEHVFAYYTTEQNRFIPDKFKIMMSEIMPAIKNLAFKQEKYLIERYQNGDQIPILILELIDAKIDLNFIDRIKRANLADDLKDFS